MLGQYYQQLRALHSRLLEHARLGCYNSPMKSLNNLFQIQKEFSELFRMTNELSVKERERLTQEFALALHTEVSSLVSEINFKSHVQ